MRLLCRVLSPDPLTRTQAIGEISSEEPAAAVLALAHSENILPALYAAIADFPEALPKSERRLLAFAHEANRRRNRQISEAVHEIAAECLGRSIQVMALKGARWIIEDADGYAGWRSMLDIDILVRVENYAAMPEVLAKLGYQATRREQDLLGRKRFAGHYHLVAHHRTGQSFVTEVHRHVEWRPELLPTESLFEQSCEVGPGLRLPCLWHAAQHAIMHWQIHHYGYQFGFHRVTDGIDIARFLGRDDVDWSALLAHASRVGIRREVDAALVTVSELFGVPLPAGFPVSQEARRYAATALRSRESRLSSWRGKQRQRLQRLWHDDRLVYRMEMRGAGRMLIRSGLWATRFRRLPFLVSHFASIVLLQTTEAIERALRRR